MNEAVKGDGVMNQITLCYVDAYGNTVARDYFKDLRAADDFMEKIVETYKSHNDDKGLILFDEDENIVKMYKPDN